MILLPSCNRFVDPRLLCPQASGSGSVTIAEDVQGTTEEETCSNRGVRR